MVICSRFECKWPFIVGYFFGYFLFWIIDGQYFFPELQELGAQAKFLIEPTKGRFDQIFDEIESKLENFSVNWMK